MRLDVVGDHSGDDQALLQTVLAQRMHAHLGMGARFPTAQAVPVPWIFRMQHRGVSFSEAEEGGKLLRCAVVFLKKRSRQKPAVLRGQATSGMRAMKG
jgi:hypothetical protein